MKKWILNELRDYRAFCYYGLALATAFFILKVVEFRRGGC